MGYPPCFVCGRPIKPNNSTSRRRLYFGGEQCLRAEDFARLDGREPKAPASDMAHLSDCYDACKDVKDRLVEEADRKGSQRVTRLQSQIESSEEVTAPSFARPQPQGERPSAMQKAQSLAAAGAAATGIPLGDMRVRNKTVTFADMEVHGEIAMVQAKRTKAAARRAEVARSVGLDEESVRAV